MPDRAEEDVVIEQRRVVVQADEVRTSATRPSSRSGSTRRSARTARSRGSTYSAKDEEKPRDEPVLPFIAWLLPLVRSGVRDAPGAGVRDPRCVLFLSSRRFFLAALRLVDRCLGALEPFRRAGCAWPSARRGVLDVVVQLAVRFRGTGS